MKLKVSRPRILFIHGVSPQLHHERAFKKAIGSDAVCSIRPSSYWVTVCVSAVWIIICLMLTSMLIPIYLYTQLSITICATFAAVGLAALFFVVGMRCSLSLLLKRARVRAEAVFYEFRPNLICACSYGAVVAITMNIPAVPVILFTPAQDRYAEKLFISPSYFTLEKFPYVLICHGAGDTVVPFEDTIRLSHSLPEDRCHLISLDSDDPTLRNIITDDEVRDILLFTYREGWITAFTLQHNEMKRKRMYLDASLLNLKDIISFASIALNRIKAGTDNQDTPEQIVLGENSSLQECRYPVRQRKYTSQIDTGRTADSTKKSFKRAEANPVIESSEKLSLIDSECHSSNVNNDVHVDIASMFDIRPKV